MKLGVYTALVADRSLEEALKYLTAKGIHVVELGSGGYSGTAHANPDELLQDDKKLAAMRDLLVKYDTEISALNCSGNPVHPQKDIAQKAHEDYEKTVLLAEKLGVKKIITFSGCPGDSPTSQLQNWVTCFWPPEVWGKILDYQWNDCLIPYWEKAIKFAEERGIKVCIELIAGFSVYNPETLLKLRAAVGDNLGANLDLSHLFWQGADPTEVIRALGPAIFHFHAKDTRVEPFNAARNGVLDPKHFSEGLHRSWNHCTVGYGHDALVWKDIIRTLRMVGYDDVISIEHEDPLMSTDEGLTKAVEFLNGILIFEQPQGMWWV
jgi:sugar phosphate isomerase/epimerase